MKLRHVTTRELRRMLRTTERAVGPQAVAVRILRRELERREYASRPRHVRKAVRA